MLSQTNRSGSSLWTVRDPRRADPYPIFPLTPKGRTWPEAAFQTPFAILPLERLLPKRTFT